MKSLTFFPARETETRIADLISAGKELPADLAASEAILAAQMKQTRKAVEKSSQV